jgi:outer membrane murein-binding lipoprotein Lpp
MCPPCLRPRQVDELSSRALALGQDKEQLQGGLAAAGADLALARQRMAALEK